MEGRILLLPLLSCMTLTKLPYSVCFLLYGNNFIYWSTWALEQACSGFMWQPSHLLAV